MTLNVTKLIQNLMFAVFLLDAVIRLVTGEWWLSMGLWRIVFFGGVGGMYLYERFEKRREV